MIDGHATRKSLYFSLSQVLIPEKTINTNNCCLLGYFFSEDVSSLGIRFRLYGCERMRRERLLGEYVLGFASLHLELETTLWLNFEPKYHLSVRGKWFHGATKILINI